MSAISLPPSKDSAVNAMVGTGSPSPAKEFSSAVGAREEPAAYLRKTKEGEESGHVWEKMSYPRRRAGSAAVGAQGVADFHEEAPKRGRESFPPRNRLPTPFPQAGSLLPAGQLFQELLEVVAGTNR